MQEHKLGDSLFRRGAALPLPAHDAIIGGRDGLLTAKKALN
jgi:hypothetical protein